MNWTDIANRALDLLTSIKNAVSPPPMHFYVDFTNVVAGNPITSQQANGQVALPGGGYNVIEANIQSGAIDIWLSPNPQGNPDYTFAALGVPGQVWVGQRNDAVVYLAANQLNGSILTTGRVIFKKA